MSAASLGLGFSVGHWTNEAAGTGCTVILPPPGNVASVDVRGNSPGSREIESLHANRRLNEIHGLVLAGGSAFGLATAHGVMEWLEERGVGFRTPLATIPIVPAAVVFDLGAIRSDVRPGPAEGRAACDAATEVGVATGRVGAGTGATVGKWAGREYLAPGGLGIAAVEESGASVSALAVVNPIGDVLDSDGTVLAGTSAPEPTMVLPGRDPAGPTNTVLAVVAVKAELDKRDVAFLAERGSDGVTATIRPAHTRYDGDVTFAVAAPAERGAAAANVDLLGYLATRAVAEAVRAAVR
ncbi:MAG TPA: P1 family peptidase [Actinomycetota bacterium]|jgi:L-aminopeptidase/D-esterase-like protein